MASKKRARVEGIQRKGVSWRQNPTKCVVEMRLPNWKVKLNFGSYDTLLEAMIARDYGAFLRVSAGENGVTAGGFNAEDRPSVYEFEESVEVFESLKDSKVRCDELKGLHDLYYQQSKEIKWPSGVKNLPHQEFCKKARKDIVDAIGKFRGRCPHKFVNSRPTETMNNLPKAEPLHDENHFTPPSSSSEVRVSPEPIPGRESGAIIADAASYFNMSNGLMSVELAVAVNGSLLLTRNIKVSLLIKEQIRKITAAGFDKILQEFFDKFLEELAPCPVNPSDIIPVLEE